MAGWKGMSRRFREMLRSGRTYVQPGVFNAQAAKIAEAAGFETVGVSGYSLSATLIGKPDVGLTTMTEVVQITGYVCDAVNIPVLADADTNGVGSADSWGTVPGLSADGLDRRVAGGRRRCG